MSTGLIPEALINPIILNFIPAKLMFNHTKVARRMRLPMNSQRERQSARSWSERMLLQPFQKMSQLEKIT
jgi:hypothetical protein